jgi:ribose transport system permease protein
MKVVSNTDAALARRSNDEMEAEQHADSGREGSRLIHIGERYGLIGAWLVLIAVFGIISPTYFLSWISFSSMLSSNAVLVVLTLGLLVPLTAGDLDMSMASTLVLSSMTLAILNVRLEWSAAAAIAVAISCGILVGLTNAFLVVYFRIHSLIVTLGTGTFIQGITIWISKSETISGVSQTLIDLVIVDRIFGISLGFYYALLLCIGMGVFLEYTTPGRRLLFVGPRRDV